MTYEFKAIVNAWQQAAEQGRKCVIATLVDLDGSAYRRPGVSMLVNEDGKMTGAISGGCIEKDVLTESDSVFKTGRSKMMTYDGRYRLGCEGKVYLLLEIFNPSAQFINAFDQCLDKRKAFSLTSYYTRELGSGTDLGTVAKISGHEFTLNQSLSVESLVQQGNKVFSRLLPPMFQLVIFGGEHDAAKLSQQASLLGWKVILVTHPYDGYTTGNFPGSSQVLQATAEQLPENLIDNRSAVVIMTHNYAKDLGFLMAIQNSRPIYLGLLGPAKRRNKLLDDFLEQNGEIQEELLQLIYGPAGLDLGAESAEEIALSICAEIIAVDRNRDAGNLKDIKGRMHAPVSADHGSA